jgi:ribosomal-protein-alanine N-acetyltransferase
VPNRLHLDGEWPAPLTIRRGWAKATARPWNDDGPEAAVRLERGSSDFLHETAIQLRSLVESDLFSPALYSPSTRVWRKAGFSPFAGLEVMERMIGRDRAEPTHPAGPVESPDWDAVVDLDRKAFHGFWRMGRLGLIEAMAATPRSTVLETRSEGELTGYALVGSHMALAYLQRVAVSPARGGQGLGTSLVRASLDWAAAVGARTMILNVKPENDNARRLYEREGFSASGVMLELLRFED